jgi:hypothetical protein
MSSSVETKRTGTASQTLAGPQVWKKFYKIVFTAAQWSMIIDPLEAGSSPYGMIFHSIHGLAKRFFFSGSFPERASICCQAWKLSFLRCFSLLLYCRLPFKANP